MALRRLRVTGFTRFLLVMVILAPLAYLGASYYNGQDGIQNLKNLLGIGEKKEVVRSEENKRPPEKTLPENPSTFDNSLEDENKRLKEELDYKSRRVDELYEKVEELQRQLETKSKELEQLKGGQ